MDDASMIQVHWIGTGNLFGKLGVRMTPCVAVNMPPHDSVDLCADDAADNDDADDNDVDESLYADNCTFSAAILETAAANTSTYTDHHHNNDIIDNGIVWLTRQ